jgi:hypothetical protein
MIVPPSPVVALFLFVQFLPVAISFVAFVPIPAVRAVFSGVPMIVTVVGIIIAYPEPRNLR